MKRPGLALAITLLAVVLAVGFIPWRVRSPEGPSQPLVVALVRLTEVDAATVAGFEEGMAIAGYREGVEVVYLDPGPAGDIARLDEIILGQLRRAPDLFLVSSTPATQAVLRLTRGLGIPVLFAPVNDPVAAGIVTDLRHPGGSVTGVRLPTGDDLRLQWLKQIVPGVRRVFVPFTPDDQSARATVERITPAASRLGLELLLRPAVGAEGLRGALAALPAGVDAIFLPRDSSVEARIAELAAFARERRLPLCAPSLIQVEAGALFSYGFVHAEIGRQAAGLAGQIFRGASPGDLPVEMAESHLSLNLATARAIGIEIPDPILLQAERVIRE